MLPNIPGEVLLNNYLQKDIKIILYPFYFVHNVFLSPKFTIRNSFIYPIGNKFNIIIGLLLSILIISYHYAAMYIHEVDARYRDNKILSFLMYTYGVANHHETATVFILNILHNKNNVLLVLIIQTLNENINIGEKCKMDFVIWNWISYLSIVCVELLLILYNNIAYNSHFVNFCIELLCIIFTLNLMYFIRLITLLNNYLMKFYKNILLVENHQGKDKAKILEIYKKIMKAYTLWKKTSHVLVIFVSF